MYGNKHTTYTCRICGRATVAGTTECPSCQYSAQRRYSSQHSEVVPYYDNPSHDGKPVGFRIVGGAYNGMIVKAMKE